MFFLNICVETANPVKHVKVNENNVLGDNSPYQTELMIVTGTLPRGISDISQLQYNYSYLESNILITSLSLSGNEAGSRSVSQLVGRILLISLDIREYFNTAKRTQMS